jgi:hypothetical protein
VSKTEQKIWLFYCTTKKCQHPALFTFAPHLGPPNVEEEDIESNNIPHPIPLLLIVRLSII